MSRNYDNWERLVAAVIKREQLWQLFHAHSRSPSVLSDASDFSSSSSFNDVFFGGYSIQEGLVFVSDYRPIVHLDDLLGASFEILGEGTFTSVRAYKFDFGPIVVVKKLKMANNISEQEFRKHMRIVGDVKHENVAALRAYCCSKDEKLMICDYYGRQSVSAFLHGDGEPSEDRANVDWKIRLRIALGAARGINHIHTQNGGKLVHGNIKSSNIFLNSQVYGIVSDLGLATMISTPFPQSSGCYAPEVQSTRNVSQASDVYSFGILLLELLTRKSPDLFLGHEAVDLAQLFDGDLLLNQSIREQIARMLEIGISCVAESPKKRPKMYAVVKMIEDIGMMNMGKHYFIKLDSTMNMENQVSTRKGRKLVFLGDGNPKFHLEDLLKASVEVLGNGTFGTSYEVIMGKGITICVKRLKDVVVTNQKFEQHMEVTGRMGHENVTELRAYYYSMDEQLLVYDYYNEGSLSAMLHGSRDSGKRTLNWKTRLNIAVGVARGIAHIHTKNERKLVHGNIRASNIFLNKQQHGMVSDVGLVELTSFVTVHEGYCAPEATNNMKVSQASDVFSFGVVLLELLSGQPSETTHRGKAMSLVRKTKVVLREEWTSQVLDAELWTYGRVEGEMLQLMQIAMSCVATGPWERPKMVDVVNMLEGILRL